MYMFGSALASLSVEVLPMRSPAQEADTSKYSFPAASIRANSRLDVSSCTIGKAEVIDSYECRKATSLDSHAFPS